MLHLLTLPFRLAFGLLLGILLLPVAFIVIPLLLVRFVIKAAVALIMLPFALLLAAAGIVFAVVAVALAIIVPLLPFALIALGVWALVQMTSRPRLRPMP
jgi:hypothetical protein